MNVIKSLLSIDCILEKSVINFHGTGEIPVIFFSLLLKKLQEKIDVRHIDIKELKADELQAQLQLSFLGSSSFFWFSDITTLNEKDGKTLQKIIVSYDGPNHIGFFSKAAIDNHHILNISLDDITTEEQFKDIIMVCFGTINKSLDFGIKQFFKKRSKFTVDQVILLSYYSSMLGSSTQDFMQEWFTKIIFSEESLFNISSLLFAKNKQFLPTWHAIKDQYAPVFWTVFWSDQFFRAFWYVHYQQKRKFNQARQISFKLPFSFLNTDWKKHSPKKLQEAHAFFYMLDCGIKNNGSFIPEAFFMKFLS